MDLQGLAALIASLVLAGGFVLQVMTFRRQSNRDQKMAEVHNLVNGQSEKLNALTAKSSYAAGQKSGRSHPAKRKRR